VGNVNLIVKTVLYLAGEVFTGTSSPHYICLPAGPVNARPAQAADTRRYYILLKGDCDDGREGTSRRS